MREMKRLLQTPSLSSEYCKALLAGIKAERELA
jgi:hypothetical protein